MAASKADLKVAPKVASMVDPRAGKMVGQTVVRKAALSVASMADMMAAQKAATTVVPMGDC